MGKFGEDSSIKLTSVNKNGGIIMKNLKKSISEIIENIEKEGVDCFQNRDTKDIYLVKGNDVVKYIEFDKLVEQIVTVIKWWCWKQEGVLNHAKWTFKTDVLEVDETFRQIGEKLDGLVYLDNFSEKFNFFSTGEEVLDQESKGWDLKIYSTLSEIQTKLEIRIKT